MTPRHPSRFRRSCERRRAAVESLTENSGSSPDQVAQIYYSELAQFQLNARITQFLPLINTRRAREILRRTRDL